VYGPIVVDQEAVADEFISLGTFDLAGGASRLQLGDPIGSNDEWVIYDAIRVTPTP
jgi:hypothetical protein